MGRGLIFFIVGMFIVMGIYSIATNNRLLSSDKDMTEQVQYAMAMANANSAIEMAGQAMIFSPNQYSSDGAVYSTQFQEGPANVQINRAGNNVHLVSTASSEEVSATVHGYYRLQSDALMPEVHGAMGIYSEELTFGARGSSFKISGCDHQSGDDPKSDCLESDMFGIAVNKGEHRGTIMGELNNNQQDNITGKLPPEDDPPSIGNVDSDGSFIQESVDFFIPHADESFDNERSGDDGMLGDPSNPKVIHVKKGGTLDISSASGSGIIIIEEGGSLDIRGTFNYEGIIIVQGTADFTRGNMHLYGAMIFGGRNPEVHIYEDEDIDESEVDIRGNINVLYSSSVLEALDEYFGNRFPRRLVMLEQYQ